MRISLNWINDYVDAGAPVAELCERLTMLGLEIEQIHRPGEEISGLVIGKILAIEPHPDADKLVVCKTDVGASEPLQIVCGAKNMGEGDKVPTATVGGELPGGFKIGKRKMRGVESQGMMCSGAELGLSDDHSGLLILDSEAPVGEDARGVLGLDDTILDIEVTPNRGDWAGMIGVAREIAAAYGATLTLPDAAPAESDAIPPATELSSVTIEDPERCPRYVGRVIQGVEIGPSPEWLQRRLIAAGQRPINNVVDVTNYVMLETGHPLHAFDYDKLAENRIVVRCAKAGETITTIDQTRHTLESDMLVIADAKSPVAVAGVMGGFDSEVDENTTNLFLESAYFAPDTIRKTSRTLNLVSESSQRFQRGADPEMASYAAHRASELILATAGGQLARGVLDEYPTPVERPEIRLRYQRAKHLLGSDVPPETQQKILLSLGFQELSADTDSVTVSVPSWRPDISCETDLIEEVGRCYGYDNIPARLPRIAPQFHKIAPQYDRIRRLRNQLQAIGLQQVITWSFSNPDEISAARLDGELAMPVPIANPLSELYSTLRTSLAPALLGVASNALRKGAVSVRIYEIAPVFIDRGDDSPEERENLCILLAGQAQESAWYASSRDHDVYDIKGIAEHILEGLSPATTIEPDPAATFDAEQSLLLRHGKQRIGRLGRVSSEVTRSFDIDHEVYLLEMTVDRLIDHDPEPAQYEPLSSYPATTRDLAVVLDRDIPAAAICETIEQAGGKHLQNVTLFDIYTGEQIPDTKKSLALNLRFQAMDRTLTDKDTDKAVAKITKRLAKDYGGQLR